MKKKIFRIVMIVLALILVFSGIILYSEKVHTLAFVENIKKALGEKNETRVAYIVTNATKVDVTYLEDNASIGHEHTFKTMYDENKHWEECTVCEEIRSEASHSYKDNGWTYGSSCREENVHKYSCSCGHSYTTSVGKTSHTWHRQNYNDSFSLRDTCNTCGYSEMVHVCYKSDGSRISCINPGRCSLCSYNYSESIVVHVGNVFAYEGKEANAGSIKCEICGIELGTVNYARLTRESNNVYNYQVSINFTNGNRYTSMEEYDNLSGRHSVTKITTTSNTTSCVLQRKFTYNEYVENGGLIHYNCYGRINNGVQSNIVL